MVGLFLAPMAQAQEARSESVPEIVSGQDLMAWQQLEQRRLVGTEAVSAYRTYLLTWIGSPLAVAAWDRLVTLGAGDEGWLEENSQLKLAVAQVRRTWEQGRRALAGVAAARKPAALVVVDDAVADDGVEDTGR